MPDRKKGAPAKNLHLEIRRSRRAGFEKFPLQVSILFFFLPSVLLLVPPEFAHAQVEAVARFTMDKQKFLLGEPVFCDFVIKNTGKKIFYFRYRAPDRILNKDLE